MGLHKDLTGDDLHINKIHANTHCPGGTDPLPIAGLDVYPEQWGAIAGIGKSEEVRTANTVAFNAAFAAIRGIGSLNVSNGPYEVNGTLLFGTIAPIWPGKTSIIGNRSESSRIISYATGTVIDAVGLANLNISGVRIIGNFAETGLLLGRAVGGDANGALFSIDHVWIEGAFSKAALITIAAEVGYVADCMFWNTTPGAKVYASSGRNTTLTATTAYGPVFTSTNTDIRFFRTTFWSAALGQSNVWLEDTFDGSFDGCLFICATPDTTNKLIHFVANTGVTFGGKVNIINSLIESGYATAIYFDYTGATGGFWHIAFVGNNFNLFSTGHKLIDYKNKAAEHLYFFKWDDNKNGLSLTNKTLSLPASVLWSSINAPENSVEFNGNVYSSDITGDSAIWTSGVLDASARGHYGNDYWIGVMKTTTSSGIPTTGVFTLGQRIINTLSNAVGIDVGWVCITAGDFAGSPPVFASMGVLTALP